MISLLFKTIPKSTLPMLRFFTQHNQKTTPAAPATQVWQTQLDAIRKTSDITPKFMIQHLEKLAQASIAELPSDIKQILDIYFEDNFKKITADEAVELAKHCSKIKGTEQCFWIWYNLERIIKPEIFTLTKQQVNDLATAYARRGEGTEMLWYDIYRAFCKIHTNVKFVFSKGVPFNYDEAYIGNSEAGQEHHGQCSHNEHHHNEAGQEHHSQCSHNGHHQCRKEGSNNHCTKDSSHAEQPKKCCGKCKNEKKPQEDHNHH